MRQDLRPRAILLLHRDKGKPFPAQPRAWPAPCAVEGLLSGQLNASFEHGIQAAPTTAEGEQTETVLEVLCVRSRRCRGSHPRKGSEMVSALPTSR